MTTVNIHEAKTHFSKLLARASRGEEVVIAKAGKPVAKLVPLSEEDKPAKRRRFGFMKGKITVPDDFDTFAADEIQKMFEGRS